MSPDTLQEEYRYLHSKLALNLTFWDWMKLPFNRKLRMSFCVRVQIMKDKDGKLKTIDTDMYSTNVILSKGSDVIATKTARFDDKDVMHNKKG